MLYAINGVRTTSGYISMRLAVYHRSCSPTPQYQPVRTKSLETDLINVNNYNATVSFTGYMHAIFRLRQRRGHHCLTDAVIPGWGGLGTEIKQDGFIRENIYRQPPLHHR